MFRLMCPLTLDKVRLHHMALRTRRRSPNHAATSAMSPQTSHTEERVPEHDQVATRSSPGARVVPFTAMHNNASVRPLSKVKPQRHAARPSCTTVNTTPNGHNGGAEFENGSRQNIRWAAN